MKVLVTGATGFVGSAIIEQLLLEGHDVIGAVRSMKGLEQKKIDYREVGSIGASTQWQPLLNDVSCIIHAAARVHNTQANSENPQACYTEENALATKKLCEDAIEAGVTYFIFISTINVYVNQQMYERTSHKLTPQMITEPNEPYGISKLEAEKHIETLANNSSMKYVILRLPLIYGNINKGNFPRFRKLLSSGMPLPFGAFKQKRSFLYINNLTDLLMNFVKTEGFTNKVYLVSDDDDVSLCQFSRSYASAVHRKLILLPVPIFLLKLAAKLLGKSQMINRLVCSIQLDTHSLNKEQNWQPPYTVKQALEEMASQQREQID